MREGGAMSTSSPLSAFLDEKNHPEKGTNKVRRNKKKALFAGLFLLLPSLSTTLAGQITLGTGAIEFGQGSQATAVCDTNITVDLQSTYDSASAIFEVSTITLGDLDTRAAGCEGETLSIKALNSAGTELDLNGSATGNALEYEVVAPSGATETRVLPVDASASVNSTAVARILIETSN